MKRIQKGICILIITLMAFACTSVPSCVAESDTTQSYLYPSRYTEVLGEFTAYKSLKKESLQFAVPGLSDGSTGGVKVSAGFYRDYIPQGITYSTHIQRFFISAYSESKQNSVIFVLSKTGSYEKTLEIGSYTGHAGGVACDSKRMYFVSGLSVYYVGLDTVKAALTGTEQTPVLQKSRIAVNSELCQMQVGDKADENNLFSSCSFCTYYGGLLWFGEFSLDTQSDDYPYRASGESYFFGVDVSTPSAPVLKKVMTVPCKTQGATFFKDSDANTYLACSMSYGRNNASTLRFYKLNQSEWGSDSGAGLGTQSSTGVKKFVHKNNNIKSLTMPNLMEDVCTFFSAGKLYLLSMYESGAKKYAASASYVMDRVSAIDIGSCLSITTAAENAATEHIFVQQAQQAADCTHNGYTRYACSICGTQSTDQLPALGHAYSLKIESPDTLVQDFEQEPMYYYTCARCGAVDRQGEGFLHTTNTIYGKMNMNTQLKDIEVSLIKDGEVIDCQTVFKSGNGAFVFAAVPAGNYTLRYSGRALLPLTLENIDFENTSALNISSDAIDGSALCAGDVNEDGSIDIADISAVLRGGVFGEQSQTAAEDVDGNGTVELADISTMLLAENYAKTARTLNY